MTRTICLSVVALLVATSMAAGQDGSARINGPVLGYVWEPEAQGVRAVLGMPGAAMLGPRLDFGASLHRAAIAQEAGYVLASAGPEGQVWLYRNLGGEVLRAPLAEAPAAPELILLSPAGSAAALVYGPAEPVAVVTGLPGAPEVRRAILPAGARLWAVSDDGGSLLISVPAGEAEAIHLLDPEGGLHLLLSTGETAAAAFLAGTGEAVIADRSRDQVYWVRGAGAILPLAGPADGISEPIAVSVSRDHRRVFVANRATATVAALDLAGGAATLLACDCKLTALERLDGNAVFRLSDLSAEPLWLLDGDAPEARVVFVPSVARGAEGLPLGGPR